MGLKTRRYLEIGELADMGHSSAAPLQRLGLWSGKTLGGAGFGFGGFLLAIFRRSGGFERTEELQGNGGDLIDGVLESGFVGFGGLVKAGDFAHELERGSADFVGRVNNPGRRSTERGQGSRGRAVTHPRFIPCRESFRSSARN